MLWVFLLTLLSVSITSARNFSISNFESLIEGNLNGLYGQVNLSNNTDLTYILCSPTNPSAVNASALFWLNGNVSANACVPFCNKPPDSNGCITGLIYYLNNTDPNITQIDVTDSLGVVIGVFHADPIQELIVSPDAPDADTVIETYYTTNPTTPAPTTLPPTTLAPTTPAPTTPAPTTPVPTTPAPTTLPPTTLPPTTLPPTIPPPVSCSPGSYFLNKTTCIQCPVGFYQSAVNATSCLPCGVGTFQSNVNSTSCVLCDAGSYQPDTNSTSCIPCDVGSFQSNTHSTTCLPCIPGTYQDQAGSSFCIQCLIGSFFNSSGVTACETCEPGTYQNNTGAIECLPCDAGTFSSSRGSTICTACEAGSFQTNTSSTECAPCAAGTYQNNTGATDCSVCTTGSYQNTTGATSCSLCAAGSYQNSTDSTGCIPCASGSYQNSTDSTSCTLCPSGTYQDNTGATQCKSCTAGSYQNSTGSTSCVSCSTGSYQNANSTTGCLSCASGTYQNNTGSTICSSCPAGTSQNVTGSTSCTPCQAGTYQANSSSTTCTDCAINTFSNTTGLSSCYSCPLATQTLIPAQTICVNIVPAGVSFIVNSESSPSTVTWPPVTYASLYLVQVNGNPIATTPNTTYTILLYDPTTWYNVTVVPMTTTGAMGPLNYAILPAAPITTSSMYTLGAYTRALNISWTQTSFSSTVYQFTLFFTNNDTGITTVINTTNTFSVITPIPDNANLTWTIQTVVPLYNTVSTNSTWVSIRASAKPTQCAITVDSSLTSLDFATGTYNSARTTYLSGQSVLVNVGSSAFAYSPVCPQGTVADEDSFGYFYSYQCFNNSAQMKVISYRHTVSQILSLGGYSVGSQFALSPTEPPFTCAAPITLATPLVPYINATFDLGTYVDYSANAFTLTAVNGPTLVANDKTRGPATVLSFGTSGSTKKSVSMGAAVLPQSYTYCFYINVDASSPTATMVLESAGLPGGAATTTPNAFFMMWTGSYMEIGQYSGGSLLFMNLQGVIGDVYLTNGFWWHYTVTYDAPSGVLSWYMDGIFVQSVTATTAQQTAWTGGLGIELGSSGSASSVAGLIDNFMVFSTALNATQVLYNFRSTYKPRPVGSASALANTISNQPSLTWTPPSAQLTTSYNLTINGGATVTTTTPAYLIPNYNSDLPYQVNITAIRYDGSPSLTVLSDTVPSRPSSIVGVQSAFGGDLTLTWTSVIPVSTYSLFISINGAAPSTVTQSTASFSWSSQAVGTNITVSLQSRTSTGLYSNTTVPQTFTIYGPLPVNAYMRFLWNNNTLDTSSNTFTTTGVGGIPPTFGTFNGFLSSSWTGSSSGHPVYTLTAPTTALPKSFSFATWIYVNSGVPCPLVGSIGTNLTSALLPNSFLVSGCGNPFQLSMKSASGFVLTVADPAYLTSVTWYHVAWTFNVTTATLVYYKNGALIASVTDARFTTDWNSSLPLTFIGTPGDIGFGGYLSSTVIFPYMLTQAQVQSLMNLPLLNVGATPLAVTNLNNSASSANVLTWVAPSPQNSDFYGITYTGYTPNTQSVSTPTTTLQVSVNMGPITYTYSAFNPDLYYIFMVTSTNYDGRTSPNVTITIPSRPVITLIGNGGSSPNFTWTSGVFVPVANYILYIDYNNGTTATETTTNTFRAFSSVTSSVTVNIQSFSTGSVYSGNSTATSVYMPTSYMRVLYRGGFTASTFAATAQSSSAIISYDSRMGPVLSLPSNGGVKTGLDYSTTVLPQTFSFSAWVYFSGTQPSAVNILGNPNTGDPSKVTTTSNPPAGTWFFYLSSGAIKFSYYVGSPYLTFFTISSPFTTMNQWTHFTVSFGQNSNGGAIFTMYVNGVSVATANNGNAPSYTSWSAGQPIVVGCQGSYTVFPAYSTCLNFVGLMKDLTFWSSALTASQVLFNYQTSLALYPASPSLVYTPYLALSGPDATIGTTGQAVWTDFSANAWPVSAGAYGAIVRDAADLGFTGRGRADIYDSNTYGDKYQYTTTALGVSYSLSAWFTNTLAQPDTLITNVGNTGALFGTNGLDNSFWVGVQSNQLVSGNYIGGDAVTVSTAWDSSAWHHFTVTYNAPTGVLSMYIDGQFKASATAGSTHISTWVGGLPIQIGWDGSSSNFGFAGDFGDLRIFNTALNSTDVAALYTQTTVAVGS